MCMCWCSDCERPITAHLTLHDSKVHPVYICAFTLTDCTEYMRTNMPLPEQVDTPTLTHTLTSVTHAHRLRPK